MNPTVKQALHFFTLVDQKSTPEDQLQELYASGLVSDLLDANVSKINRDEFRRVCGLKSLVPELKIWKTVKLGVHKTPGAYRQALNDANFRIGNYANQILDKVTVAKTETEVDLAVLTVAEMSFKGNARYDAICVRIVEIGGMLCPDEVGPALREQYPGQSYGEWNAVAMEPLADSDGVLSVFRVDHDRGGRWLNTNYGNPDSLFNPDNRIVFVVPRNYLDFSPPKSGEFCFLNCLSHPPICLPISPRCFERVIYFLSLMILLSQLSCSKNLVESNFDDVRLMTEIFLSPAKKLAAKRDSATWIINVSIRNPSVCRELAGK